MVKVRTRRRVQGRTPSVELGSHAAAADIARAASGWQFET
jgi:hypothetical protein